MQRALNILSMFMRIFTKSGFLLYFLGLLSFSQEQHNVLFIAFDDLRPLIGAYGESEPITPNIDALANESFLFSRSYVSYPLCLPSRAAMLTGIRFNNQNWVNGKKVWTLSKMIGIQSTWPKVLKDNGYWTATRGKIYHGNVPTTDKDAWDIAGKAKVGHNDAGPEVEPYIVEIGGRHDQIEEYYKTDRGPGALLYASVDGPDNLLNDGKTADDVIKYIKDRRDKSKPFLISCGFWRPHMPWVAPKKYFDLYPEDAGKLAYIPEGTDKDISKDVYQGRGAAFGWNEGVDDKTAKKLIRGYMASVSYADAQMGKVIQVLKDEGLYDNTIIIVWGDHGYHLTDHGKWRKNTGYNVSLRNPFIIKTPNSKAPKVIDNVVQNIDIYPTVLELLGISQPKNITLHGRSLVPLLINDDVAWNNTVYTCAVGNYGLITQSYRFTKLNEGGYQLFDLKKDPHEWNNLANKKKYKSLINKFDHELGEVAWNKPR